MSIGVQISLEAIGGQTACLSSQIVCPARPVGALPDGDTEDRAHETPRFSSCAACPGSARLKSASRNRAWVIGASRGRIRLRFCGVSKLASRKRVMRPRSDFVLPTVSLACCHCELACCHQPACARSDDNDVLRIGLYMRLSNSSCFGRRVLDQITQQHRTTFQRLAVSSDMPRQAPASRRPILENQRRSVLPSSRRRPTHDECSSSTSPAAKSPWPAVPLAAAA